MPKPKYIVVASRRYVLSKYGKFGDKKSPPKLFDRKKDADRAIEQFLEKFPMCGVWELRSQRHQ